MRPVSELMANPELTIGDLLLEIISRIDQYLHSWEYREFLLAQTTHIEVGHDDENPTLIYQNAGTQRVLLEIFNVDPAQTLFVSVGGTRRSVALPIFPESSEKVAVPPGQDLYGIVEGGTIDVRFAEFNIPMA